MSRQNDIDDAIWADPPFHDLPPLAKLVYVWSFSNPRVGMAGIYKVPRSTIGHEIGCEDYLIAEALTDLQRANFVFYDGTWLWVRARIKRLKTRTVQMCRSVAKQVAQVPVDHPFRVALLHLDGDDYWASTDIRTTICQELGGTGVSHGSDPGFPASKRKRGYHPSTTQVVQGQGQGKGLKPLGSKTASVARTREAPPDRDWPAWASEHLPDLPIDFVCMTAVRLAGNGSDITPERVRQHVLAAHPSLAQEAA